MIICLIKFVSGEMILVLGRVEVFFYINFRSYFFNVIIIDVMVYDVILGCDFFEFYKVKIDFEYYIFVLENELFLFENFVIDKFVEGSIFFSCVVYVEFLFIILL